MSISNGIILLVADFQACVRFYETGIRLPILMRKEGIVRFALGSMYLQVEDAKAMHSEPTRNIIIRNNTEDLRPIQQELRSRGLELEIHDLEWGEIGFLYDPSGNKFEYLREK